MKETGPKDQGQRRVMFANLVLRTFGSTYENKAKHAFGMERRSIRLERLLANGLDAAFVEPSLCSERVKEGPTEINSNWNPQNTGASLSLSRLPDPRCPCKLHSAQAEAIAGLTVPIAVPPEVSDAMDMRGQNYFSF